MQRGLHESRNAGAEAVVVLGDPRFHRRFEFSAELAASLQSQFHGEVFMALEFVARVLTRRPLVVEYPQAFSLVE